MQLDYHLSLSVSITQQQKTTSLSKCLRVAAIEIDSNIKKLKKPRLPPQPQGSPKYPHLTTKTRHARSCHRARKCRRSIRRVSRARSLDILGPLPIPLPKLLLIFSLLQPLTLLVQLRLIPLIAFAPQVMSPQLLNASLSLVEALHAFLAHEFSVAFLEY